MTDERDGQTYKTVTIGTQTWMAENLNYESVDSYCYNDSAKYCAKYGRLYTWAAAMDSVGEWSTNGRGCGYYGDCSPTYPVRGVCPKGWHLLTKAELEMLLETVGGVQDKEKYHKHYVENDQSYYIRIMICYRVYDICSHNGKYPYGTVFYHIKHGR